VRPAGVATVVVPGVQYCIQLGIAVYLIQQPNHVVAQLVRQRSVLRLPKSKPKLKVNRGNRKYTLRRQWRTSCGAFAAFCAFDKGDGNGEGAGYVIQMQYKCFAIMPSVKISKLAISNSTTVSVVLYNISRPWRLEAVRDGV